MNYDKAEYLSPGSTLGSKEGRLSGVAYRISLMDEKVMQITASARSTANSVLGPSPEMASDGSNRPDRPVMSSLDKISTNLDSLENHLAALQDMVSRLGDL